MRAPRLVVFSDAARLGEPLVLSRIEHVFSLAEPGTVLAIVRDYDLGLRRRHALGLKLRELARRHAQRFGVADRLDLALTLDADAVHLGEASVQTADARRLVGPDVFVTRSSHDPASMPDADAILLAPIFAPRHGRDALGIEALARAAKATPVYALGAVDATNARSCLDVGAVGIAAIGALLDSHDPTVLIDALGIQRGFGGSA